jgi:hypothetical protein
MMLLASILLFSIIPIILLVYVSLWLLIGLIDIIRTHTYLRCRSDKEDKF